MPTNKEKLDKLESRLLKELFYGNFKEALEILKAEEQLLKFNQVVDWLFDDINSLPIGTATKKKFIKKGMRKFIDLAFLKPIRCENYQLKGLSFLQDGEYCAVEGIVYSKRFSKKVTTLTIKTDNGSFLFCNWFRLTPFLKKQFNSFKPNDKIVCEGRIDLFGSRYSMSHPKIKHPSDFTARQEIVYPSVFNLKNATIKKTVDMILDKKPAPPFDYLPYTLIVKHSLPFLNEAIENIHRCENEETVERRLKYEEIFLLMLGLRLQETRIKEKSAPKIEIDSGSLEELKNTVGFELTGDQIRVIKEILQDIKTDKPMLRLLQGDVGCGKTVVALFAAYAALKSGYQAAFMAPTQPLASQIYGVAKNILGKLGIDISLLISSTKDKKGMYERIETGQTKLVVGTHALLEEGVKFNNLGFIVVDEQHRFGVEQRKNLMNKGIFPHVLIMSATPIPRSLSMVLYSKSSLSTIKEKPKGRAIVKTLHFFERDRKKAYGFASQEIKKGHQVYIVAPLIEESEKFDDVSSAVNLYEELTKGVLSEFSVGLLHGRMNALQKEAVIEEFKKGALDCLVSTTVIEVGIDSPNATVMIIENAERFGLSQLHQLRGRVGRGMLESYALLITKNELSDTARKRIDALLRTNDGFEIAQLDYELRGSGEIMGIKQHGKDFVYTNIVKDRGLIEEVKEDVERLMKMHYPINDGLLKMIEYRWEKSINYVYVG